MTTHDAPELTGQIKVHVNECSGVSPFRIEVYLLRIIRLGTLTTLGHSRRIRSRKKNISLSNRRAGCDTSEPGERIAAWSSSSTANDIQAEKATATHTFYLSMPTSLLPTSRSPSIGVSYVLQATCTLANGHTLRESQEVWVSWPETCCFRVEPPRRFTFPPSSHSIIVTFGMTMKGPKTVIPTVVQVSGIKLPPHRKNEGRSFLPRKVQWEVEETVSATLLSAPPVYNNASSEWQSTRQINKRKLRPKLQQILQEGEAEFPLNIELAGKDEQPYKSTFAISDRCPVHHFLTTRLLSNATSSETSQATFVIQRAYLLKICLYMGEHVYDLASKGLVERKPSNFILNIECPLYLQIDAESTHMRQQYDPPPNYGTLLPVPPAYKAVVG